LFRADLAEDIGTGHFKRCFALARALEERAGKAIFAFRSVDDSARFDLKCSGIPFVEISKETLPAEEARIVMELCPEEPDAVVFDMANYRVFEDPEIFTRALEGYRGAGLRSLVIDGFRGHALCGQIEFFADFIVTPYLGAIPEEITAGSVHLAGEEFFITPPDLVQFRRLRNPAAGDRRVLVTCGGSDPLGFTPKLLAALDSVPFDLQIAAVIGPSFSAALRREAQVAGRVSKHAVRFEHEPASLGPLYTWCDAAVATSGLTKYELAVTGTPAVLVSIDNVHCDMVADFVEAGLVIHVGVGTEDSFSLAASELRSLLENPEARRLMMCRGPATFDDKGAARLLDRFCEEVYA
jgi:spore coat polysaccharide biosynthesis protein SpsF